MLAQFWNKLGPEGAGALAGALEKMTGMQSLELVSGEGGCWEERFGGLSLPASAG